MIISDDILYVGVNDHDIDLFEGQYEVPLGMAYNSYLIRDDKIAVMDSVESRFADEWLNNINGCLDGKAPDYLVIQHMEPDHSSNITSFMNAYPEATIVSSAQAFKLMGQFYGNEYEDRRIVVAEGDTLELGEHTLHFVEAPMVHWPEVIVTYDDKDKVLFSADGFGKFGANDVEDPEGWDCEARRYYFGIVGKYGMQVTSLLEKAAALEINTICPLHGPVLSGDLSHYLSQYKTWAAYDVESEGVMIAYTSVYGHTREAAHLLAEKLKELGCPKVAMADLAREDMPEAVEDAFRYGKLVLATTTYNMGIFPFMHTYIEELIERNYKKRKIGIIENGSWSPAAARNIKKMFAGSEDITFCENKVTIRSALNEKSLAKLDALAKELMED